MIKLIFYYLCLVYTCNSFVFGLSDKYVLKSISVVFRHGDRTPEPYPIGFYPNDPYVNRSFEPMGFGALTNEGKKREHQIGVKLRERYNEFLSDIYKPSEISVVSTPPDRTKMSLLLILSGLYPPKDEQVWMEGFNWQPISISSIPLGLPTYLFANICPTFKNEYERIKSTDKYKQDLFGFDELMRNLTILTGRTIDNAKTVYHLYHTLTAEQGMNLALPDWTKPYFPDGLIINATLFEYQTQSYTPELIRMNGGVFLRKILNDNVHQKKIQSTKLYLYSVHDNNIAGILYALKLWKNIIPAYGSGIVIEFYEKESKLFVRTVYYKGIPAEFEIQKIPGCAEYCPLEDFIEILKNVIPDDTVETCFGPPSNSLFVPQHVNPISWIYEKIKKWFDL